jgi:UDP-N-acetylglucosamine 2-epimerase (non-hydrolysing)
MKLAYIVGARPNFVKIAPVIAELRARFPAELHLVVHTGQHYDPAMSQVFFEELGIPEPDHLLGVGSASHGVQTARVIERLEPILDDVRPDLVLVPGDVNSTLAAALTAVKLGISVAHLESGLRSFDRTMPEEINRLLVDQISDVLFLHSQEAVDNLLREGVEPDKLHFVGNTMIDTLVAMEARFRTRGVAKQLGLDPGGYLLVTLHRPALVDGPLLEVTMDQLSAVAREIPVVFPVHPRTRSRLTLRGDSDLVLTEPLAYLDFLSLEADARAVLTDSGGIQEETTYLRVPCFTLRDSTERRVTIREGTNTLLGLAPESIARIPTELARSSGPPEDPPPLWDGRAAMRVADVVAGLHGPKHDQPIARLTVK